MNENVVSIPQAREDIYHQRLNLIRNCYGDLFDAEFVARASLTSATAAEKRPLDQPQSAEELAVTIRDIFEGKAVLCNINGESGKAAFFAPEVKLDVAARLIREWSTSLTSATEGERDWIRVDDYLPDPLEDVDVVIVRFSAGKFVDQWSQIASRRPDGMWIDDDGLVERSDDADYRVITHWAKRIPLPMSECPCHYGQDGCCAFCLKMHAKQKDKSQ